MNSGDRRYRLQIRGRVQGVGFRPTFHRVAVEQGWSGWVLNNGHGVAAEVEGPRLDIEKAMGSLRAALPRVARIDDCRIEEVRPWGSTKFEIRSSETHQTVNVEQAPLIPDQALCDSCIEEIRNPHNRRHLYPFTTCSECGPRYSITRALPFDRANTAMDAFPMCPKCRDEYSSPSDRRHHAQTIACPECGPRLLLKDSDGVTLAEGREASRRAAIELQLGKVIAVKGIGGFHLMVDATNEAAVQKLRARKRREAKPFAALVGDLSAAERLGHFSKVERDLFLSPESPIVLVRARSESLAPGVAPRLNILGIMRAHTPLHHILLWVLQRPLVATSGNLSDEPICYRDQDAIGMLGKVADLFLTHDREIVNGIDDSIVREIGGRGVILRLGRGLCPATANWPSESAKPEQALLAYGAQIKSSLALSPRGSALIHLGPHLGSLDTVAARDRYAGELRRFPEFYGTQAVATVCDLHPDYTATVEAEKSGRPFTHVQHHAAHVLSCLVDNNEAGPVLGVAWDGSGFGGDGTLWGGEFLRVSADGTWSRLGHLRRFRLPGGDRAVREPRRAALGLLYEIYGETLFEQPPHIILKLFTRKELEVFGKTLRSGLNSPICSSAGRLFDGVAALLELCPKAQFEGQAAMELECSTRAGDCHGTLGSATLSQSEGMWVLDWEPVLVSILSEHERGHDPGRIAHEFHAALAKGIRSMSAAIGLPKVALTGGVFQNRLLTEMTIGELRAGGVTPFWHRNIPPNDGGIAAGQILGWRIKCV